MNSNLLTIIQKLKKLPRQNIRALQRERLGKVDFPKVRLWRPIKVAW